MTAEERFPPWIKVSSRDMDSAAGRYMLAGGSQSDWADYGRWFALRQILATTPGAFVDARNARMLGSLSRQLGFSSPRRCREWLQALADCGAIDRGSWDERGEVVDVDVYNSVTSYQSRCRTNARNKAGSRERDGNES